MSHFLGCNWSAGENYIQQVAYTLCYFGERNLLPSFHNPLMPWGHVAGGTFGWGLQLQAGKSQVRFPIRLLGFFIESLPHHGPGIDSASNRNEYQEYFLEVKVGRCLGLTNLPLVCVDCLEIMGASNSCSSNGLFRLFLDLRHVKSWRQRLLQVYVFYFIEFPFTCV